MNVYSVQARTLGLFNVLLVVCYDMIMCNVLCMLIPPNQQRPLHMTSIQCIYRFAQSPCALAYVCGRCVLIRDGLAGGAARITPPPNYLTLDTLLSFPSLTLLFHYSFCVIRYRNFRLHEHYTN
ncbi:hypothetical protein F5X99DRAFT_134524 [Biscogniauxia marginata]|nr:hypothetical protein F5X99DRAFT_134524 [Biscogniauxia marginata]